MGKPEGLCVVIYSDGVLIVGEGEDYDINVIECSASSHDEVLGEDTVQRMDRRFAYDEAVFIAKNGDVSVVQACAET